MYLPFFIPNQLPVSAKQDRGFGLHTVYPQDFPAFCSCQFKEVKLMNCPTERSVIRSIEKMRSTDCIAYGIRVRLDSFSSGCLRTIRLGLGHETSVSVACLFGVNNIEEQSPLRHLLV